MKIALTGASGLLGRALASLHVAHGDAVRGLVRAAPRAANGLPGVELIEGDLGTETGRLAAFLDGADVVYHCAAELNDPARMEVINVDATRRLLSIAEGRIGRWVQASTVAVYGHPREGTITEASPLAPKNSYARTKARADALVAELATGGGFEHVILRTCALIGPGMQSRFLHRLIGLIERGLFAPVGPPGALVSLLPVANAAHALQECGHLPQAAGKIFIIADQCSVDRLVALQCEVLGRRPPRWRLPEGPLRAAARFAERLAPGRLTQEQIDVLTSRAQYSCERIRQTLGYNHVMNLEEALRRLAIDWREGKA